LFRLSDQEAEHFARVNGVELPTYIGDDKLLATGAKFVIARDAEGWYRAISGYAQDNRDVRNLKLSRRVRRRFEALCRCEAEEAVLERGGPKAKALLRDREAAKKRLYSYLYGG